MNQILEDLALLWQVVAQIPAEVAAYILRGTIGGGIVLSAVVGVALWLVAMVAIETYPYRRRPPLHCSCGTVIRWTRTDTTRTFQHRTNEHHRTACADNPWALPRSTRRERARTHP